MNVDQREAKGAARARDRGFPKLLTATVAPVVVAGLVSLWFYRHAEALARGHAFASGVSSRQEVPPPTDVER